MKLGAVFGPEGRRIGGNIESLPAGLRPDADPQNITVVRTDSTLRERQTIRAYGAELPLEPDLVLQADIVAERRSLISWLLDPLLSVWRRS